MAKAFNPNLLRFYAILYSDIKMKFPNLDHIQMALRIIYCTYSEDVTYFFNELMQTH